MDNDPDIDQMTDDEDMDYLQIFNQHENHIFLMNFGIPQFIKYKYIEDMV